MRCSAEGGVAPRLVEALELATNRADEEPGTTERPIVAVELELRERLRPQVEQLREVFRRPEEVDPGKLDSGAEFEPAIARLYRQPGRVFEDPLCRVGVTLLPQAQAQFAQELAPTWRSLGQQVGGALQEVRGGRRVRSLPGTDSGRAEPLAGSVSERRRMTVVAS